MKQAKPVTLGQIKGLHRRMEERIYAQAFTLIERKARAILRNHPDLDEYVMAMGGWFFTGKDRSHDISTSSRDYIPWYARPFERMMDAFEEMELKVTGEPMRFTANGPVVSDWGACDGMNGKAVAAKYHKGDKQS